MVSIFLVTQVLSLRRMARNSSQQSGAFALGTLVIH